VSRTSGLLPEGAWPVWTLSNHDVVRFPTRLCGGDDAKANAALLFLLTLRGTPVLYYGDELGMRQVEIPPERTLDAHDRDGARTPMPWGDVDWRDPRLPLGTNTPTVSVQREDTGSVLTFCRDLLRLRRAHANLQREATPSSAVTAESCPGDAASRSPSP
jgi:alpha-glucosidase